MTAASPLINAQIVYIECFYIYMARAAALFQYTEGINHDLAFTFRRENRRIILFIAYFLHHLMI